MYPAFSHFLRMALSMGTWASNQSWLILSKQDLMSPSSTHWAEVFRASAMWHWSMASAVDLSGRNP